MTMHESFPTSITVTKDGISVFKAEAGRLGRDDSACRDFICYASPIIGAAYHHMAYVAAAKRIASLGYATSIAEPEHELTIPSEK